MLGQACRYLFKQMSKLNKKQKLQFPFDYLNDIDKKLQTKNAARSVSDFKSLDTLDQAMQVRACHLVSTAFKAYSESTENVKRKENDIFQQARLECVNAHLKVLQLRIFRRRIAEQKFKDPKVKEHLETLGKIFALDELLSDTAAVYDTGFFAPGSLSNLKTAMDELVVQIRPQLIPIVECLHLPDHVRPSTIGNSYGDIYEWQLQAARESRNNSTPVVEYFEDIIKPMLQAKL